MEGRHDDTKCTSRSFASWNVGGQNFEKVDFALREFDFAATQEISRAEVPGWDEKQLENFTWFSHRHEQQWRGVAIGVATDLMDCVLDKMSTAHGAAWFLRLKGHRRMTVASLHCPTGVTVAQYQEAVGAFKQRLRRWHPECPAILGVDVNEVIQWTSTVDEPTHFPARGGGKMEAFLELLGACRMRACPPIEAQHRVPTHFPRDATREGRHIDTIASRLLRLDEVKIIEAARMWVNTDHALLYASVHLAKKWVPPRQDTRPRWVVGGEPLPALRNLGDLYQCAAQRTRPSTQAKFQDDEETRAAARRAKDTGDAHEWKGVHAMRRRKRKIWIQERFARILAGDWGAYRNYKNEKNARGWWGKLLAEKSSKQVADEAAAHLSSKMWDEDRCDWDKDLEMMIGNHVRKGVPPLPVTSVEVWGALEGMKPQAALGPDGVSISLLRTAMLEQPAAVCAVIDEHIVADALPTEWFDSFLALLAKVACPGAVAQLRPISMSCTMQKLVTRIVMNRCFDQVRKPCRWAASGKGRQVADLIGAVGRFRDVCREWRMGGVMMKLDIRGAFDFVHREAVAQFLISRLANSCHQSELAFLLRLLRSNRLLGQAPGGALIEVKANRGIRQGSPESAELFGMLIQQVVIEAHADPRWRQPKGEFDDLPLDGGCFQDDIVMWGGDVETLHNNVEILIELLAKLGLNLAVDKTGVIAMPYYQGMRSITVGGHTVAFLEPGASLRILGVDFCFDENQSQQAKGLMGRVWAAWSQHAQLLRSCGSYMSKVKLIRTLLQGTWQWVAGAVHWGNDDLRALNSLQLRLYRLAFGCKRYHNETWTDFNSRTCRWIRAWIYHNKVERWSTTVLRLQHQLAGHWGRQ